MARSPIAFFLTSTTYGTWLEGDIRSSVNKENAEFATERLPHNPLKQEIRRNQAIQDPMYFTPEMIRAVDEAIREVCNHRKWTLHALNVRTNHFHAEVSGNATPEKMLGDFKAYATRRLRRDGLIGKTRKVWTDGGSTIYVWTKDSFDRVLKYIQRGQGPDLRAHLI